MLPLLSVEERVNRARRQPEQAPGEAMLQAALAADAKGAARRSAKDPFADLGVKFVEVQGPTGRSA
jgi:hypothetical protein